MHIFSYSVSLRQEQILIRFLILVIFGSILTCVSWARSTGIVIPRMVMFSFFQTNCLPDSICASECFMLHSRRISDLLKLMDIPEAAAKSSNISMIFKMDTSWNSENIWVSSAYCLILNSFPFLLIPMISFSCLIVRAIVSAAIINGYGDKGHPCLTPLLILKYSDACPLFQTQLTI